MDPLKTAFAHGCVLTQEVVNPKSRRCGSCPLGRAKIRVSDLKKAIRMAIAYCKEHDLMKEFFEENERDLPQDGCALSLLP